MHYFLEVIEMTEETIKKNHILKIIFGSVLVLPWFIYQLSPLFKWFVLDVYQLIFTGLMIAGIILFSTIRTDIKDKNIKLPKV